MFTTRSGKMLIADQIIHKTVGPHIAEVEPDTPGKGGVGDVLTRINRDPGIRGCVAHRKQARVCVKRCGLCKEPICTGIVPRDADPSGWTRKLCREQCLAPLCTETCVRFEGCHRFPSFPDLPTVAEALGALFPKAEREL